MNAENNQNALISINTETGNLEKIRILATDENMEKFIKNSRLWHTAGMRKNRKGSGAIHENRSQL
jgi:hypothetical protein